MPQPERVSPKHENVMDVTIEQLARVYAKAFMGVAAKTSNTEALVEDVHQGQRPETEGRDRDGHRR